MILTDLLDETITAGKSGLEMEYRAGAAAFRRHPDLRARPGEEDTRAARIVIRRAAEYALCTADLAEGAASIWAAAEAVAQGGKRLYSTSHEQVSYVWWVHKRTPIYQLAP